MSRETIYQGDDFAFTGQASGLPANDFTGYTISARVGLRPGCTEQTWQGEDITAAWGSISTGVFALTGNSANWPVGDVVIQIRLNGKSSSLIPVRVEPRV